MPLGLVHAMVCTLALALLWLSAPALAEDGDGRREAHVTGSCAGSASSELRVRTRDGAIRVEFVVRSRMHGRWRVVLVHERHVDWRGSVRNVDSSFRIRRSVRDLRGPDAITLRASGPGGPTCSASAALRG